MRTVTNVLLLVVLLTTCQASKNTLSNHLRHKHQATLSSDSEGTRFVKTASQTTQCDDDDNDEGNKVSTKPAATTGGKGSTAPTKPNTPTTGGTGGTKKKVDTTKPTVPATGGKTKEEKNGKTDSDNKDWKCLNAFKTGVITLYTKSTF